MKRIKEIQRSDMFEHMINLTYLPRWGVLLIDMILSLIAFTLSYVIGWGLFNYTGDNTNILPILI